VAESNLKTDASGDPIAHPLLGRIFQSFVDGQYHLDSQS
jgi:heat shock protein HspQ